MKYLSPSPVKIAAPYALIFLSLILMLGGCASYMTQSQNVSNKKKSYSKILVVARGKNEIARSLLEQDIAAALLKNDVSAVAYHKNSGIDVSVEADLSEDQIADLRKRVIDMGFDGVIITHLVRTEVDREAVPGSLYPTGQSTFYDQFGYYWSYYPTLDWAPGFTVSETQFVLESALHDILGTQGKNLQWVGRFKLADPTDIQKTTKAYAGELVKALMEESIQKN